MCEMGFMVSENGPELNQFHRLVKKTEKHMIVVTYKIKRRLIKSPVNAREEKIDEIKAQQIEGEGFGQFLKRHGLVPPDMMGYDEEETRKEYMEGLKTPGLDLLDDEDDFTMFDIALINKNNTALMTDCNVRMGEIKFNRFTVIDKDADEFVRTGRSQFRTTKFHGKLYGPRFDFLSENLQNQMIEYLYSAGLRPEIGLCVENLSWNKEQRLYMAWLRDLYALLFVD